MINTYPCTAYTGLLYSQFVVVYSTCVNVVLAYPLKNML